MAPIDALTDLPNRALFIDRLERSMIRMRRRRGTMALLDLDIDHFGEINEKRGHATGDVLLRTFAERISRCLRAEDTVARVGGDEFAVIIEGLRDRGEALRAADAILAAARREIALPTGTIRVSSSIGIAFFDGENGSVQQLLDEAHGARLKVQSGGGDAYFYADAPVGAVELQDPSNDANL
jgi:diguanylate cyclase (GGDEF)-like protein